MTDLECEKRADALGRRVWAVETAVVRLLTRHADKSAEPCQCEQCRGLRPLFDADLAERIEEERRTVAVVGAPSPNRGRPAVASAWESVAEAARRVGVSRQAVHKRVAAGELESWDVTPKEGTRAAYVVVLSAGVDRWIEEREATR